MYRLTLSARSCATSILILASSVRETSEKGMKCVLARRDVRVEAAFATMPPIRSSCAVLTSALEAVPSAASLPRYAASPLDTIASS